MNRHIEPGCLAVVTNSAFTENIGRVVKVIREVGGPASLGHSFRGNLIKSDICWEIDTPLLKGNIFEQEFSAPYHIERWLMRIDGHTEPEEVDTAISNLYEEI